jgi:hypothetical protein
MKNNSMKGPLHYTSYTVYTVKELSNKIFVTYRLSNNNDLVSIFKINNPSYGCNANVYLNFIY